VITRHSKIYHQQEITKPPQCHTRLYTIWLYLATYCTTWHNKAPKSHNMELKLKNKKVAHHHLLSQAVTMIKTRFLTSSSSIIASQIVMHPWLAKGFKTKSDSQTPSLLSLDSIDSADWCVRATYVYS
jgi:hypothetical protein